MFTYQIKVEYLGTNFVGWQIQKNGISVQEVLEKNDLYDDEREETHPGENVCNQAQIERHEMSGLLDQKRTIFERKIR